MKFLILFCLFTLVSCQQKDLELIQDAVAQPGTTLPSPSPVPAAAISSGMAPSSGG